MSDPQDYVRLLGIANRRRTSECVSLLRSTGFEPVVIKGWAVARFYDTFWERVYSDCDVAFDPADFGRAVEYFSQAETRGIAADLHEGLRTFDNLPWEDLYSRSYNVDLDGTPIRVLADEDNLRVTALHWLTDGGVNKERLWDIYYLVKNRNEDFDWQRCLESNGPVRKTWVMAAIATARDHLELDLKGLPEKAQSFQLPEWYMKTLDKEWKRGVYPRRVLSTVLTRPKLLAEQIYRRFPPNKIAATVATETPIDDSPRLSAQLKSLTYKVTPFARGLARRLTYRWQKHDR